MFCFLLFSSCLSRTIVTENHIVSGALLGAFYGASNMPSKWIDTVINADVHHRVEVNPDVKLSDLKELAVLLAKSREPTRKNVDFDGFVQAEFPNQPVFAWKK